MKTTCLIIDDHQLFSDGLAMILRESEFFDVIGQVSDSRQTYAKCLEKLPQLVIMDYNMPHLNGLQVVKQLKTLPYTPKIVVVSMYADQREIEQFEKEGVQGYFPKTTASPVLIHQLLQIMSGKNIFEWNKKSVPSQDHFQLKNQLTKREIEVLQLIKEGLTTEQMAEHLGLSYYTIETHRKNINHKLKFASKKEMYDFLDNL